MVKNGLRKTLSLIIVLFLIVTTSSAYSYWDSLADQETESVAIGDFLYGDPISTAQEFYDLVTSNTTTSSDFYELTNDIDFTGFNWEYDSTMDSNTFRGTFDGNGYALKNISITSTDTASKYISLFTKLDGATIKDLEVDGYYSDISSTFVNNATIEAGLLAGVVTGTTEIKELTLNDINVIGNSANAVGGLVSTVGNGADVSISNIKATNMVVMNKERRVGGLVGKTLDSSTNLLIQDIDIQGYFASDYRNANTGGIVGTANDSPLTITRAIVEYESKATIQLSNRSVTYITNRNTGGIIGQNNNDGTEAGNVINDTFYTGILYGTTSRIGTAIGRNNQPTTTFNNSFYSNVLFDVDYTESSGNKLLNLTRVNGSTMPDQTWWNNYATSFNNGLWRQDSSGRLILIR